MSKPFKELREKLYQGRIVVCQNCGHDHPQGYCQAQTGDVLCLCDDYQPWLIPFEAARHTRSQDEGWGWTLALVVAAVGLVLLMWLGGR